MGEPWRCVYCGQSVGREWWDLHVKLDLHLPRYCEPCLWRNAQGAMLGKPAMAERFRTDGREVPCQPNA